MFFICVQMGTQIILYVKNKYDTNEDVKKE